MNLTTRRAFCLLNLRIGAMVIIILTLFVDGLLFFGSIDSTEEYSSAAIWSEVGVFVSGALAIFGIIKNMSKLLIPFVVALVLLMVSVASITLLLWFMFLFFLAFGVSTASNSSTKQDTWFFVLTGPFVFFFSLLSSILTVFLLHCVAVFISLYREMENSNQNGVISSAPYPSPARDSEITMPSTIRW